MEAKELPQRPEGTGFSSTVGVLALTWQPSACNSSGSPRGSNALFCPPRAPAHMGGVVSKPIMPALGRQRQEDSWGSLASQSKQICELWSQRKMLFAKVRWRKLERWLGHCVCSGPGFDFQHQHGGSQCYKTPALRQPTHLLVSESTRHTCSTQTYLKQNTHTHCLS